MLELCKDTKGTLPLNAMSTLYMEELEQAHLASLGMLKTNGDNGDHKGTKASRLVIQ